MVRSIGKTATSYIDYTSPSRLELLAADWMRLFYRIVVCLVDLEKTKKKIIAEKISKASFFRN